MDIKVLKSCVVSNSIPNFLIFLEKEYFIAHQYLVGIGNTLGKDIKYYTNIDDLYLEQDKNKFINVVFNSSNDIDDACIDSLIGASNDNLKIVLYSLIGVDSFSGKYKKYCVVFDKLDNYTILAYLQKQCKNNNIEVDQERLLKLIEYCDCNMSYCMNELEKIICLGQKNSNLLINYMFNNGFSNYKKVDLYNFINKIENKDLSAFNDLEVLDDSPVTVFFNIYSISRAKYVKFKNSYYLLLMRKSIEYYLNIINNKKSDKYAVKEFLLEVIK